MIRLLFVLVLVFSDTATVLSQGSPNVSSIAQVIDDTINRSHEIMASYSIESHDNVGSASSNTFVKYASNSTSSLVVIEKPGTNNSDEVFARNSKYKFQLKKSNGQWLLTNCCRSNENSSVARNIDKMIDLYSIKRALNSIGTEMVYELLRSNNFVVNTIDKNSENDIIIKFTYSSNDIPGKIFNPLKSGEIVLDSKAGYCIRRYKVKLQRKGAVRDEEVDVNAVYKIDNGFAYPQEIKKLTTGTNSSFKYQYDDPSKIRNDMFLLTAFGIVEPSWMSASQVGNFVPWYIYITAIGILFLMIASIILYRRNRQIAP
ncbi:MAG: hypothetical protein QM703_07060 [Gemmatales bacterium]